MTKLFSNRSAKKSLVLFCRTSLEKFWSPPKTTLIFTRRKWSKTSTFWRTAKTMKTWEQFLSTFWKINSPRISWIWFKRRNTGKSWSIKKKRSQLLSSVSAISLRRERGNRFWKRLRLFRPRRTIWLRRPKCLKRRKLRRLNMRKVRLMLRDWLMRLCRKIVLFWLRRFWISWRVWRVEVLRGG